MPFSCNFAAACGFSVLLVAPAAARVTVCDQLKTPVLAAIGYVINNDTETAGWWTVPAGGCAVVDSGPLSSPFYLVTRAAPDAKGHFRVWGTGTPLVVSLDKFHFYDAETGGSGDTLMNFQEVTKADTDDLPNVTWTVKDEKTVAITYDETP